MSRDPEEDQTFPKFLSWKAEAKAWQWQWAVELLRKMPAAKVLPNEVSFSAAISACEKAEYFWQDFLIGQNLGVLCACLKNQGFLFFTSKPGMPCILCVDFPFCFFWELNVFETF